MKNTISWLVIAVIVVVGGYFLLTPSEPVNEGPIKIGFIAPLSGEVAGIGEPIRGAVVLAVKEINENGGIGGRMIEMIYEDGKCTGAPATSATQKLVNIDKVKYIIGGLCSGETLAAAPVAEAAKVILFSPGSGSPEITNAGDYIFRNFPSDATSGKKVAESAFKNGLKKVSLLIENNDYSQALKEVFKTEFEKLGGEIIINEDFLTDVKDLRTPLIKIKESNSDAVYLVTSNVARADLALKQFAELGLDIQLLSNEFMTTPEILENHVATIEGVLFAEPTFNPESVLAKEYLDKHLKEYGTLGEVLPPFYLTSAYDAVYILKEMIEKKGDDVEKVKEGLYQIKNREGASGSLTIDENGDPEFEYVLKTIKDGKVIPYEPKTEE